MTKSKYHHGISCHSGSLFSLAHKTLKRSNKEGSIATVIFSALATEAFLNDIVGLAEFHVKDDYPEALKAFAAIMPDLDEYRVQFRTRFLLATYILGGKSPNKGSTLVQDIDLLIRLRNEFVHTKPEPIPDLNDSKLMESPHKLIKRLLDQKIIRLPPGCSPAFWRRWISNPNVAQWSINVAVGACKYLFEQIPEGWFRQHIKQGFAPNLLKMETIN